MTWKHHGPIEAPQPRLVTHEEPYTVEQCDIALDAIEHVEGALREHCRHYWQAQREYAQYLERFPLNDPRD